MRKFKKQIYFQHKTYRKSITKHTGNLRILHTLPNTLACNLQIEKMGWHHRLSSIIDPVNWQTILTVFIRINEVQYFHICSRDSHQSLLMWFGLRRQKRAIMHYMQYPFGLVYSIILLNALQGIIAISSIWNRTKNQSRLEVIVAYDPCKSSIVK